jgi:histidyl-tRNA synthetase
VDAEVIEMVVELLRRVGLSGFQLYLNSVGDQNCRPQYVALLKEKLRDVASQLCGDCQRRAETNPLRVLDCKVPEDQEIINALPSIQDHLCEPCRAHFTAVRAYLDDRGIPYEIKPRMVRGLDYYMRTTFEIVHGALGAQNSVLGGGRYDGLAEALDSKVPAPGIGFSIGEDRLVMSAEQEHPESYKPALDVYIAPMGGAAERHSAQIAQALRAAGCSVEMGLDAKLKRSLDLANKMSARFALIVGENEIAAGRYTLKNMQSGEQQTVDRDELIQRIK